VIHGSKGTQRQDVWSQESISRTEIEPLAKLTAKFAPHPLLCFSKDIATISINGS